MSETLLPPMPPMSMPAAGPHDLPTHGRELEDQQRNERRALTSMILGLSSLVVAGLVLGPLAIIYAIRGGTTNPMAMTGLISGIIGTILGSIVGIIFMIMWTVAAEMS